MFLRRTASRLLRSIDTGALSTEWYTDTVGGGPIFGLKRWFSDIPEEYSKFYKITKVTPKSQPEALVPKSAGPVQDAHDATSSSSAAPLGSSLRPSETVEVDQKLAAKAVSAWMFPWERRQMDAGDGKGLRTWEKWYWGFFVTAIAFLLYSRVYTPTPDPPKVDEKKEARKEDAARALLAGQPYIYDDDDPFEGMTPQEIEAYVAKVTGGASSSDPFEGMSPEEINEYMARMQQPPH
eukprot:jgi/Botrbrau1/20223/Bobra.31_1s0020.1